MPTCLYCAEPVLLMVGQPPANGGRPTDDWCSKTVAANCGASSGLPVI